MEFSCKQEICSYEGAKPYVLYIPPECYMDEHNLATPFCPHCGNALTKSQPEEKPFWIG